MPETEARPLESAVLMADPGEFRIAYVINPHMAGNIGDVDQTEAKRQWNALGAAYESIGMEVVRVAGEPGLPGVTPGRHERPRRARR